LSPERQMGLEVKAAASPQRSPGPNSSEPRLLVVTYWLCSSIVAAPAEGEKMLVWPSSQRTS
jgi:hypothetical protein